MYYINYSEQGKILGFAKGETDLNVEVSNSVWFGAMNGGYNKIIIDGSDISFDKVDWRTQEEIAAQERAQKKADFEQAKENLKVGYSPSRLNAFRIMYGSELGEKFEAKVLYNCDTMEPVEDTDHLYKCNNEAISLLTAKIGMEYPSMERNNWYGSLGTIPLDSIELGFITKKAEELVQYLADTILGGQQ